MDLDKIDRRQHFVSAEKKESSVYPNVSIEFQSDDTGHLDKINNPDENFVDKNDIEHVNSITLEKDDNENIERIHSDQISVDKKKIDEETVNKMGSMDGVRYKTKDVAAILNISEQTIRNNAAIFNEFLSIEKTPTGHRRYSKEDIEKLRLIFQLKTDKGFTNEQTMEYLKGEQNGDYTTLSPEKKLDLILLMITKTMEETADNLVQSSRKQIEQNNEMYNQNLMESTELIKKLSQKLEEKENSIALLQSDREELILKNKEFQEQIEELNTQSKQNHEDLLKELEEIKKNSENSNKKKWKFW